jgi:hypothetical protein
MITITRENDRYILKGVGYYPTCGELITNYIEPMTAEEVFVDEDAFKVVEYNAIWMALKAKGIKVSHERPVVGEKAQTTKECPRCQGSGHYSYNPRYGTVCFQCEGRKWVPATPKGQPRLKPTCDSVDDAGIGDIIKIGKLLYRVDGWLSGDYRTKPYFDMLGKQRDHYAECLLMRRIADNAPVRRLRKKTYSESFFEGEWRPHQSVCQ